MKLFELGEFDFTTARVGSYYKVVAVDEDTPVNTVVRVSYIGLDEPEPNDTGTVVQFDWYDESDKKKYGEWYYENFDARTKPASNEEIAEFLAAEKRAGRKFLDSLKNNDKEE